MNRAIRICAVWLMCFAWLSSLAMAQEAGDPFEIFAVLWRGETEVEDGFRDYLDRRGIPYRLTIRIAADAPGERLMVCRNPLLADEQTRKREDLLEATEVRLDQIVEATRREKYRLKGQDRIALRVGKGEINRVQPDLVYTWGTVTTSSIIGKLETGTPEAYVREVPGVFVMVSYPLQSGIVATLENPGRPATGVTFLPSVSAQLKTIETYGKFRNIAVIYEPNASNSRVNVEELQRDIRAFDMNLIELPVPLLDNGRPDPEQIPALIQSAKDQGADLLYMGPDSFLVSHANAYTSEAIAAGLPTFASSQAPLKNSRAMFGLVTDYYTLGKLAGLQAERILVGKQDSQDLPVAQLARYKLWINIDVVHEVGIYPPMKMISIADFKTSPDR